MNTNNMVSINLMLAGSKPSIISSGNWCGVDGGAKYLIDNNIIPLVVYGDLDSFNYNNKNKIVFKKKYSQDLTDFEFSLENIIKDFSNIKNINVYGATGNRIDHFLGNIMLLKKFKDININIIDDNNYIFLSKLGINVILYKSEYKYISFIPTEENTTITIKNAKYNVNNYLLTTNRPNATSNEFLINENIIINVDKECLVIYSKD